MEPHGPLYQVLPIWVLKRVDVLLSVPMGDRYHGNRALEYDEIRSQQEWWHRENQAMRTILSNLEDCHSVLDVPCGSGRFFPLYHDFGMKTTGLDISHSMLKECREKHKSSSISPSLEQGSATAIPFGDCSFDLVVSFRFLQSIVSFDDAQKAIREMARVSSKYVVLELDFLQHEHPRRFLPSGAATMRGRLTKDEIRTLLESSGLDILSIHGPFKDDPPSQFAFLCKKRADLNSEQVP